MDKYNTKKRNNKLIGIADQAIKTSDLFTDSNNKTTIKDGYNGQIAALGVAIAMSELRPALAIYYQDKPKAGTQPKVNRREVLNVIATMITLDSSNSQSFNNAEALFRYALRTDIDLKWLKREIIDCSIALKQVVRTYNME